jgi:hypothetical protein
MSCADCLEILPSKQNGRRQVMCLLAALIDFL